MASVADQGLGFSRQDSAGDALPDTRSQVPARDGQERGSKAAALAAHPLACAEVTQFAAGHCIRTQLGRTDVRREQLAHRVEQARRLLADLEAESEQPRRA